MRFWLKIALFTIVGSTALGQKNDQLGQYLVASRSSDTAQVRHSIDQFIAKISAKQVKSDRQLLRGLFNLTQRQLLKTYEQYAGFGEIFQSGRYDCLTATALYSHMLTQMGYPHTIMETNYHIFLLVDTKEGQILMESTDPISGFEYQQIKIEERIKTYKRDQALAAQDQSNYVFSYTLYNEVSADQLTGLLYYNQCVDAFNHREWMLAAQLLANAKIFYNSPRILEMENLLVNVIAANELQTITDNSDSYQFAKQIQQ